MGSAYRIYQLRTPVEQGVLGPARSFFPPILPHRASPTDFVALPATGMGAQQPGFRRAAAVIRVLHSRLARTKHRPTNTPQVTLSQAISARFRNPRPIDCHIGTYAIRPCQVFRPAVIQRESTGSFGMHAGHGWHARGVLGARPMSALGSGDRRRAGRRAFRARVGLVEGAA